LTPAEQQFLRKRRLDLCAQLQSQRRVIAQQLGILPGSETGYPRSKTMRLLTQRPEIIISLLGGLARLLRLR